MFAWAPALSQHWYTAAVIPCSLHRENATINACCQPFPTHAVGTLRAAVPEDRLQRMFDQLSAAGLDTMPEWQARMALIGFQRLRFQPGIEALEPFVQFKKQQRQQEAQEEEAQEQDAQQQQEEASEQQQQQ